MKPIKGPDTNTALTLKGSDPLPAEQCWLVDPQSGEQRVGFETIWQPDDGERRALANGAPILLRLWGQGHPPVSVVAGEPAENAEAMLPSSRVTRALAWLYRALQDATRREATATLERPGGSLNDLADFAALLPEPDAFIRLWQLALEAADQAPPGPGGDGGSIDDVVDHVQANADTQTDGD